jgi:hypothetical protein
MCTVHVLVWVRLRGCVAKSRGISTGKCAIGCILTAYDTARCVCVLCTGRGQVGGSIASDAEKLAKPFAL